MDYKRVVSYIYQYSNQLKGNNIGFARIETRNTQCKITIHIRVPNISDRSAKAYLYCWINGGMHGVLLGDVTIKNGIGEFQLTTEAENLCNTKYEIGDMSGIIVYLSDTMFLGTEWDDHAIVFDTLDIDEVKPMEFYSRKENAVEDNSDSGARNATIETSKVLEKEVTKVEKKEEPVQDGDESLSPSGSFRRDVVEENEYVQVADVSNAENEIPENFPLDKEKLDSLDQQAHDLFGSMLMNSFFPNLVSEEEKDSKVEEELKTEEVKDEEQEKETLGQKEEISSSDIAVDAKTALEYFTTFKSCESQEEYDEIQEEIKRLTNQVCQLDRIGEEWVERMKKQKEEEEQKLREKEELEKKVRESLHIGMDVYEEDDEKGQLTEQSIATLDEEETETKLPKRSEVVNRIFAKYPTIDPFEDTTIEECIRIEPQDIGIFPMENWILANNSFLLHGYYSYRHLIFAMKNNNGSYEYFLGVPGIDHSRERFMAKMFGFNDFIEIRAAQGNEQGNFGYWCFPIKMR